MDDDTVRVKISYSPDRSKIGTFDEVSRVQASVMVAEGRARYVDSNDNPIERRSRSAGTERPATERPVLTPAPPSGNAPTGGTADLSAGSDASAQMRRPKPGDGK